VQGEEMKMLKFGDIVKFSPKWLEQSVYHKPGWLVEKKKTRMVVVSVDKGDQITIAKEGRHRVETYHKMFLVEVS
jgi:hypothetical protein